MNIVKANIGVVFVFVLGYTVNCLLGRQCLLVEIDNVVTNCLKHHECCSDLLAVSTIRDAQ